MDLKPGAEITYTWWMLKDKRGASFDAFGTVLEAPVNNRVLIRDEETDEEFYVDVEDVF